MAKHSKNGDDGFSVHGRDNRGTGDGERNPGRENEAENEARFSQAEADARAQRYADRHDHK